MKSRIMAVGGEVDPDNLEITDAHNHVWIEPVAGSMTTAPVLNHWNEILAELRAYAEAGGRAIVDCQPAGCGRDGLRLSELSRLSGVVIVASTGFHRRIYYSPDYWLWSASADKIANHFIQEIREGLQETFQQAKPVKAGMIKIACEESLQKTYRPALEGAAAAAVETGLCLQIHTEKGQDAENIANFFLQHGLKPQQFILCHMDKRPDFSLHRDLAQNGIMLEYDSFYRPKYHPEIHLWSLIESMVAAGFEENVVLATDMAESSLWNYISNGPGLVGYLTIIRPHLLKMGLSQSCVKNLMGANINRCLAGSAV